MIKVLKDGKLSRATCDACSAILEYGKEDVKDHYGHYAEKKSFYRYIECPCCKNEVVVE